VLHFYWHLITVKLWSEVKLQGGPLCCTRLYYTLPHPPSVLKTCPQIQLPSGSCFLQVCPNTLINREPPVCWGMKWLGHEADHSSASSAQVKSASSWPATWLSIGTTLPLPLPLHTFADSHASHRQMWKATPLCLIWGTVGTNNAHALVEVSDTRPVVRALLMALLTFPTRSTV